VKQVARKVLLSLKWNRELMKLSEHSTAQSWMVAKSSSTKLVRVKAAAAVVVVVVAVVAVAVVTAAAVVAAATEVVAAAVTAAVVVAVVVAAAAVADAIDTKPMARCVGLASNDVSP